MWLCAVWDKFLWLTGGGLQIAAGRFVSDAQHASDAIVGMRTGKKQESCLTAPGPGLGDITGYG